MERPLVNAHGNYEADRDMRLWSAISEMNNGATAALYTEAIKDYVNVSGGTGPMPIEIDAPVFRELEEAKYVAVSDEAPPEGFARAYKLTDEGRKVFDDLRDRDHEGQIREFRAALDRAKKP